jgi:drug/metabolite transporter (DMT)-like permease
MKMFPARLRGAPRRSLPSSLAPRSSVQTAPRPSISLTLASRTSPLATWSALVIVYIVWGSTYLAIRVVVGFMPPLLAMGTRFAVAGTLMGAFLAVRYGPRVLLSPPRRAASAALVGVLLLTCGNGAVAVAEQNVPSGLTALLVAAVPLWFVCLRLATRDAPRTATTVGTVVGFGGIALLALPGSHPAGTALWGVLVILAGTICWATGSFVSQRLPMPSHPFVSALYEMLAAGAVLLVAGVAAGEPAQVHLAAVPVRGWVALGYLVVFGSLVAFSAYAFLLGRAPISLTGTYAYVNPAVAVLLGALLLGEPLTGPILVGGAIVLIGVGLVVSAERTARGRRAGAQAERPVADLARDDLARAGARGDR